MNIDRYVMLVSVSASGNTNLHVTTVVVMYAGNGVSHELLLSLRRSVMLVQANWLDSEWTVLLNIFKLLSCLMIGNHTAGRCQLV